MEIVWAFECPVCTGAVEGEYDKTMTCACGHTFTVPHPSRERS